MHLLAAGNLIQRYDMDEYIWAALALYLGER